MKIPAKSWSLTYTLSKKPASGTMSFDGHPFLHFKRGKFKLEDYIPYRGEESKKFGIFGSATVMAIDDTGYDEIVVEFLCANVSTRPLTRKEIRERKQSGVSMD
ncbi:hypothetical protein ES703_108129 [subsurface metagenome]